MRGIRVLVITVGVLLVLAVVVDRVTVHLADGAIASRIQTDQQLTSTPDVSIGGFPFLTQVAAGDYQDVSATANEVDRGELVLSRITVHAHGVRVPLSDVLHSTVQSIPVDHADGEVLLSYTDLNDYLRAHVYSGLTVAYDDSTGRARVSGQIPGTSRTVSGEAAASVSGNVLTIYPASVPDVLRQLPVRLSASQVSSALTVHISLGKLPFGITVTDAHASSDGVVITGAAAGLTLQKTSG